MKNTKIYLVGAGPGDIDLITVKGLKCIQKADVIIYDRLANKELLNYAKKDCVFVNVGKPPKNGGHLQENINDIIIRHAKKYKNIVRLKGGDPFLYGRGGEEILEIIEAGYDFEVIPGITSAFSVPAYAGIPVTFRGISNEVHIFSGHNKNNEQKDNYEYIAKLNGTIIFLMGVSKLPEIVSELMKYGKESNTKIAIIQNGTSKSQEIVTGTFDNIIEKSKNITSPAIIIIGEVVSLHEKLYKKRYLMFKSTKLNNNEIKLFKQKNVEITREKIIKTIPNKIDISILKEYKYLIFNSIHGVKAILKNVDKNSLKNKIICCTGEKSADKVKKYGLNVKYVGENSFESLYKKIREIEKNPKILIVTSNLTKDKYNQYKNKDTKVLIAYNTVSKKLKKEKLDKIASQNFEGIIFTSGSNVESFYKNLVDNNFNIDEVTQNKRIISIGPSTTKVLNKYNIKIDIEARDYSIKGIVDII